jgi:hypothetical protein
MFVKREGRLGVNYGSQNNIVCFNTILLIKVKKEEAVWHHFCKNSRKNLRRKFFVIDILFKT